MALSGCRYIAYKITHTDSGKAYVGITTRALAIRWKEHKKPSEKARSTGIWRAINKYGKDAFSIEQLASASSLENLLLLEAVLIKQHGTLAPNGYNLVAASDGIWQGSEETRLKLSTLARNMSDETKAKISAAGLGRVCSKETCEKIGAIHRGAKRSPETIERIRAALFARPKRPKKVKEKRPRPPVSEEARAKLSFALKGKPKSEAWRKYLSERQMGRVLPEQTRQRISMSLKARFNQSQGALAL